jgi:pyridoxine/pyridoxamine 5'-phosphate oxidase
VDQSQLIELLRERGLAVIASRGPGGEPQAALVGIAATDRAELLFDTSTSSRKYANLTADPRVAVVIGWEDEVTCQLEGLADVLQGAELRRGQQFYFAQYPGGRQRAAEPDIALIRVRPLWLRYSDYRPDSFGSEVTEFTAEG